MQIFSLNRKTRHTHNFRFKRYILKFTSPRLCFLFKERLNRLDRFRKNEDILIRWLKVFIWVLFALAVHLAVLCFFFFFTVEFSALCH